MIESPCTKVCLMHDGTGLCRGCYRTLDEIACWGGMDDPEREQVLQSLRERRAKHGSLPREAEPEHR